MTKDTLKLKGAAWKPIIAYVTAMFGEEALKRVLDSVSPECYEIAHERVLVNNWYDIHLIEEFITAADRILGTGDLDIARKMGAYSAEFGIKSVYKIFMKVGTPTFVLKRAPLIWNRYYSRGEAEMRTLQAKQAVLRLTDMGPLSAVTCIRVTGWMETTLRLTGAKNAKVEHVSCPNRGDAYEEWEAHWE